MCKILADNARTGMLKEHKFVISDLPARETYGSNWKIMRRSPELGGVFHNCKTRLLVRRR